MKDKILNFIKTLELTNIELSDLIDITKITKLIDDLEMKLNALNYIICQDELELERKIRLLFEKDKSNFDVLPYLVAISKNKISNNNFVFKYKNSFKKIEEFLDDPDMIIDFINITQLKQLIISGKIKNFIDYLSGVEVGLDSNARKNRFGQKNENEIYNILNNEFSKYPNIKIDKQLILEKFKNKEFLKNKKWDFVITNINNNKKIIIETSYYNTSGSKINETSKSFENINNIIKEYKDHYFLWLADGEGLKHFSNSLVKNYNKFNFINNKKNFIDEIKKKLEIK